MKKLSLLIILSAFIACSDSGSLSPGDTLFGNDYSLVTEGELPVIQNDTLFTEVTYSGCNGGHDFKLISRSSSSPAQVWLYKETPDQDCEAFFRERKSYPLNEALRQADDIQMLAPDGERVVLR